jgi:PhoH-like ATPase
MESKKVFVIDTNVLIHDPQSVFGFSGATVVIPMIVLEELDQFKTDNSDRGRNAREVIRSLDMLRSRGSLKTGVDLDNGGKLRVLILDPAKACSRALMPDIPDNLILNMCVCLREEGFDVVLISKDLNMRVKADVIGIRANDYLKDEISVEKFYKGWITFQVPAVQLKKGIPSDLLELAHEYPFSPNEYVVVESQHNPHIYKLFRYKGNNDFKQILAPNLQWGIEPRNVQQLIALDLLLDDSIQLVTLLGPAGTGKTFLALVAALHKLLVDHVYTKILISRPVIPLGPDIGYLPGTLGEKLHNWMQPIYDNMEFIVHVANASQQHIAFEEEHASQSRDDRHDRHGDKYADKNKKNGKKPPRHSFPTLDELVTRGKISLEAITYMRGRSIPYQFIFIDEVQNLNPHEVKTIISRVGEGSKIVLAGDPYQIDSPYLDFVSNGLMVASQKFKGQPIFGTAFLEISERSELSKLAGKLL